MIEAILLVLVLYVIAQCGERNRASRPSRSAESFRDRIYAPPAAGENDVNTLTNWSR